MSEDDYEVTYEVTVSGDRYEHQRIRGVISDMDSATLVDERDDAFTLYVLEETPDGSAETLAPIGVFRSFEKMNEFVNEEYDGDSSGLRWTEHDLDALLPDDEEETHTLEAFMCRLCDEEPPDITDADDAIEHLVDEHDVERGEAEQQVEMLAEVQS